MDSLWILAIIAGLVLINGIFVGAEFALIRAPRLRVEQLAAQGGRSARWLARVLHEPRLQDRYVVTTQLGVTFASLGLGMFGEHAMAERLVPVLDGLGVVAPVVAHTVASAASLLLLTYVHVVFGEMLPKIVALGRPLSFALAITPFVLAVRSVLYPIVAAVEWTSHRLLRAVGIDRRESGSGAVHTMRELQHVVLQSQEGGLLDKESGDVLYDLFEFGELTAGEAMVPRVAIEGIPLDCRPEQMLKILQTSRHTRYPVFEDDLDDIVGMVHVKDLLMHLRSRKRLQRETVRRVPFLPETARLDRVLATMRRARSHMVIVMDEHGGTSGLLTEEDLFEEVFGNIEEATHPADAVESPRRSELHVAGTLRLDELGEQLDMEVEHEEADTVSGLVLMLLERPAAVGDVVTHAGLRFEVTEVEGRGVKECAVRVS